MSYPPLTSVEEYPLHGWDYGDEYACQRPEDPGCVVFDWRCRFWLMATRALLASFGDRTVRWRRDATGPEQTVRLSWLVDRSSWWMSHTGDDA